MTALLDTHVLIWWLNDSNRLSPAQQEVVASGSAESPLLVSDISLWEVATLHSLGRIQLTIPLRAWLDKAAAPPLVRHLPGHCGGAGHVARLGRGAGDGFELGPLGLQLLLALDFLAFGHSSKSGSIFGRWALSSVSFASRLS